MTKARHGPEIKVTRVQTGVRIEQRMLRVLKALAEYFDLSLGDLLEGIVLHAFEGQSPFYQETLQRIEALKQVYGMDYDASASHHLIEAGDSGGQGMPAFQPMQVVVYSLWARDVPATVHFYRDVMGLRLLPHHGHRPAFDLGGGSHLVIVKGQPVPALDAESPPFPSIAFAVEDLDGVVQHLERHGIELPWGIEAGEGTRWVKFWDPAGNLIELAQFDGPVHP
jgi:catechol 2,3-dioxygenase-like lactoylglutathione lyase family enzyme